MNKIKVYKRKQDHLHFVRGYVCDLHNKIFQLAIHGCLYPNGVELYKKYNRYLRILEF